MRADRETMTALVRVKTGVPRRATASARYQMNSDTSEMIITTTRKRKTHNNKSDFVLRPEEGGPGLFKFDDSPAGS